MSYHVETTPRFDKEFKKLDKYTQQMIKSWIGKNLQNCENPRTHGKGLIAYKMSQASPTPLVKNKKVLYSSIFKNEYRTHYIRKYCFYKFYQKTF